MATPVAPPWAQTPEGLDDLLHEREGFRDEVYLDSLGKPTVGYGHLLGDEYADQVGTTPFSGKELEGMFYEDRDKAQREAVENVGRETWVNLSPEQQTALTSMAFQLGGAGQRKFKKLLKAVKEGDAREVAKQALTGSKGGKSKWLKQTPKRALDVAMAFDPDIAAQYKKAGGMILSDEQVMYRNSGGLTGFWNNYIAGDKTQITDPNDDIPYGWNVEAGRPYTMEEGIAAGTYAPEVPVPAGAPAPITNADLQQAEVWERQYEGQDPDDLGNAPTAPAEVAETVHPMGGVPPLSMPTAISGEDAETPVPDIGSSISPAAEGQFGATGASMPPVNDMDPVAGAEEPGVLDWMNDNLLGPAGRDALNTETDEELKAKQMESIQANEDAYMEAAFGQPDDGIIRDNKGRAQKVNPNRIDPNIPAELAEKRAKGIITQEQYDAQKAAYEQAVAQDAAAKADEAAETQAADVKNQEEAAAKAADLDAQIEAAKAAGDDTLVAALEGEKANLEGNISASDTGEKPDTATAESNLDSIINDANPEDTGPGDGQAGENADVDTVVATGESNPKAVKQSEGVLKSLFGDLFDTKELTRMAVMYAGSRLMGYSHGGSLSWAAKNYIQRVDSKASQYHQLAASGKYTTASLKSYKESGDPTDLKPVGVTPKALGNFKTFYKNGRKYEAQEYDMNGQKIWMDGQGNQINQTYQSDPSTVRGTPEYGKRVKEDSQQYTDMLKGLRSNFGTHRDGQGNVSYSTELTPDVAGNKIAKWALDENIPPEYMGGIIENAYHSALEHSQRTGEKVRDLRPFLEEQYVIAQVGDSSLFRGVSGTNVNKMMTAVQNTAASKGANLTSTQIMQGYRAAWEKLGEEGQKAWNSRATDEENGFMKFVMNDISKS